MFHQVGVLAKQRVVVGLALCIVLILSCGKQNKDTLPFKAIQRISNDIRFNIHPVRYSDERNTLEITVKLESFKNPDAIDTDLMETTMIVDDERNPYIPSEWQEKKRKDHTLEGTLLFHLNKRPKTLSFHFYELEEHQFDWPVSDT